MKFLTGNKTLPSQVPTGGGLENTCANFVLVEIASEAWMNERRQDEYGMRNEGD